MRYFVQAFVVIVGFGLAIASARADQSNLLTANCYEVAGASVPTICE